MRTKKLLAALIVGGVFSLPLLGWARRAQLLCL